MRALLLLALTVPLAMPQAAQAKTRLDKFGGGVDSVNIESIVEVPLVQGAYGDDLPYINVKFAEDDDSYKLFIVGVGYEGIILNSAFSSDFKVKTHNKKFWASLGRKSEEFQYRTGGKFKTTRIDQLIIGDGLVLEGVSAQVAAVDSAPLELSEDELDVVAGIIGLGSLPLAAAILPSEGVVRFAPAQQGAQLLQQVGASFPYESTDSFIAKFPFGKEYHKPRAVVVPVQVADQSTNLALNTSTYGSWIDDSFNDDGLPAFALGDLDIVLASTSLNTVDLGSIRFVHSNYSSVPDEALHGFLGNNALRGLDIAIDPENSNLAIRPAAAQKRSESIQGFIDSKTMDIADLDEDPPEDADAQEAQDKSRAELLALRGRFHVLAGEYDQAVADLQEATSLDPDPCQNWQYLGWALWLDGKLEDSVLAVRNGMERYLAWSTLDRKEREKYQKMKPDKLEELGIVTQDLDTCDDVFGELATIELSQGNVSAVLETYQDHLDLHPLLPTSAGMAYLLDGKMDLAQGPLRQAIKLSYVWSDLGIPTRVATRFALAYLFTNQGYPENAITILDAEAPHVADSPFGLDLYAEAVRKARGEAAVRGSLLSLAKQFPDVPQVFSSTGLYLRDLGELEAAETYLSDATELYEKELSFRPETAELWGQYALHLVLSGNLAAAGDAIQKALELQPASAMGQWAAANLEAAQGNADASRKHYDLAVRYGVLNIGLAMADPPAVAIPEPEPADDQEQLQEGEAQPAPGDGSDL